MSIKSIVPVLAVDDLDRATSFYRDKLGCSVRDMPDDPTSKLLEIGDSYFLLYKTSYKRGENTVASVLVSDFDTAISDLRGKGIKFEDYDFPGLKTVNGVATYGDSGMKGAWFKDTEGNTIAVVEENAELMRKAA